ncbi:MAG: hypothetical protein ACJ71Q_13340 [Terriglobales bacterium]
MSQMRFLVEKLRQCVLPLIFPEGPSRKKRAQDDSQRKVLLSNNSAEVEMKLMLSKIPGPEGRTPNVSPAAEALGKRGKRVESAGGAALVHDLCAFECN